MKKSHKWIEMVEARCPYCRCYRFYGSVGEKGDVISCKHCYKLFQLGKQR